MYRGSARRSALKTLRTEALHMEVLRTEALHNALHNTLHNTLY